MANLPQRPVECDQRYSPEDRHYPPTFSRMAPMRYDRRDDRDRDPRSRPEGDVYVPPPSRGYASSYVGPYDRHEGDRYKNYRHDPDHRREEDTRPWYNRDKTYRDNEPRSREREHYGRVDSRRRERDTWVASDYDWDRRQGQERDRGRDYARERERERERDQGISRGEGIERPLSPRRDPPRPRRDSRSPPRSPPRRNTRSPPRRTGPHTYADYNPNKRRRSMSPRWPSHYQHHQSSLYAHDQPSSTTQNNSRAPTPLSKHARGHNHSIANSPRSPVRYHEHPRDGSPRDSTRHHSPPRRASRSRSPVRDLKDEPQLDIANQKRSSSPPTNLKERPTDSSTLKQISPTPPRSPSPVQVKSIADVQLPSQQHQPQDKGKLKEQAPADNGDTDTKMRDSSPSPPRHPRNAPSTGLTGGRPSRSPPRGPRNHPKTPTAPASFYHLNAPGSWSRRNNTMPITSPLEADQYPITDSELPPVAPVIATLPMIPVYPTKPSITCELDKEIARIQAHRAHLVSDYVQVAKATRRALHELDIATIDLRAAENRRKLADSQVERARAGLLGINAMPVS